MISFIALVVLLAARPADFVDAPAPGCNSVARCEKSCKEGSMPACRQLGMWYQDGDGVAADATRALSLDTKACDGNDARACMQAGGLLATGSGAIPKDAKKAVPFFEKSCAAKDLFGCAQLGRALQDGDGVEVDHARALSLLKKACNAKLAAACSAAGDAALSLKDLVTAEKFYRLGCEQKSITACGNLGTVVKDPAEAARLYQQACDADQAIPCANLADLYQSGEGVKKDAARAAELLKKACKLGDTESCK